MNQSEYHRQWRAENSERYKASRAAWRKNNPEKIREMRKKWASNAIKREGGMPHGMRGYKFGCRCEICRSARAAAGREFRQDPTRRLLANMRTRLYKVVKRAGGTKSIRSEALVGCSIEALRAHLERQFTDGMTWQNYGQWHVDHIKPCISFNLADAEQQAVCFHFSNLRPLWAEANAAKGARMVAHG